MIRSTQGAGRSAPGEGDFILGTAKTWTGQQANGVIFCHGAGDTHEQPFRDQYPLLAGLARHATVSVADLGGDAMANDTAIARIEAARVQLGTWGVTGKIALVGMSMGNANALAYALAYPANVACVAGVIPLTDLVDAQTRDAGVAAAITAAYPPSGYDDVIHGPAHNPIRFADNLTPNLPVHLWSASNDIYTPPAVTQAFVDVRPQTGFTDVGPLGHADEAVTAATPAIIQFVRANL